MICYKSSTKCEIEIVKRTRLAYKVPSLVIKWQSMSFLVKGTLGKVLLA
jgi:hypothetical protein